MDSVTSFGATAKGLARNPLGIIALFIVLVYGFACLVTAFSCSMPPSERIPLVYFVVVFPILVLIVFAWLVSKHSGKLFAPGDYRNDESYIKVTQIQDVAEFSASVAVAASKGNPSVAPDVSKIVNVYRRAYLRADESNRDKASVKHVLWVDDRPQNNLNERRAFEALGLKFTLAETTQEALAEIKKHHFNAIISDMGRREGPREGYVLLDKLRQEGNTTPLFFYAASNSPQHKQETAEHGGQGCTNNSQELLEMVSNVIFP